MVQTSNQNHLSNLAGKIHRFSVLVDCRKLNDTSDHSAEIYADYGFILFPESYTESGKPTRLVISCHGAGGTVDTDDSQVEHQALTLYLLANGYAVMDVNGLPREFADKYGIDIRNNIGSYIAIQSYVQAYAYCIHRFNLKREVFVHGGSMGGITSTNLVLCGKIPVIAQSGFCPVLDTYNEIFLHPWSGGLPKTALGILYSLEKDRNGCYIYDENKIRGLNPVQHKKARNYPVPLKFWHCMDDEIVSCEITKAFVERIKNAGGDARLRLFETGGHEPQEAGSIVTNPCGYPYFKNEKILLKTAVEEAFLWIREFDFE